MTRFLRAWAWVRWRTFMNAIERSHRTDRLARFSRAIEVLGPVFIAVMLIPSALLVMALGAATGYGIGSGAPWGLPLMHAMRIVLLLVIALSVMGPLLLPSGRGLASLPRLLLLPVSHKSLFAGEVLGGFAEPWTLLGSLMVIMVPVGALAAGNLTLALVSIVAALALIAAFVALGALFGALLHLMMRDRKRGEWLIVLFFTLVPLAAMAPAILDGTQTGGGNDGQWEEAFEARMGELLRHPANGALAVFPPELFMAANARTAGLAPGGTVWPVLALGAVAAGATAGGWAMWKRTIDRGGISRGRAKSRRGASGAPSTLAMMRTPMRALAFSFLQHVLRTARGRTIVLPSLVITVIFAALVASKGGLQFGAIPLRDGFSVALFGVGMSLLSIVQLWMNQFAIDKAGLTMLCVQPLTSAQILRGKMAGAAILLGALAALPIGAGLLIGATVHPAYWSLLAIGGVAAFIVLSPAAALLSAIFPKHVDMSSIGQKSNAHPAAGLLGGLLIFAAAAPTVGAALFGFRVLESATAAVGLAGAWLLTAVLLHLLLWKLAVATFERRRESLMAVAAGR